MTRSNRNWYQFSMRSLLAIVTALCIGPCSWVAYERAKSAKQRAAVETLESIGSGNTSISYDVETSPRPNALKFLLGDDIFGKMTCASLNDPSITDEDLVHLEVLPDIAELFLGPGVSDKGLVHIQHLSKLTRLDLSDTQVTDKGLGVVRSLFQLEELYLDHTDVTDAGLSYLHGMKLTQLSVSNTEVTDAGLMHLAEMTTLEYLNLAGTQVTDRGLMHLEAIKTLTEVNITHTAVTEAGKESLQAACPRLAIVDRFRRPTCE